jgi:hypothetical protein
MVFLPPGKDSLPEIAHLPDDGVTSLLAAAYAQVASRGPKATWEQHARNLVSGAPYAGRWTLETVPDGSSARQALRSIREDSAMASFEVKKPAPAKS